MSFLPSKLTPEQARKVREILGSDDQVLADWGPTPEIRAAARRRVEEQRANPRQPPRVQTPPRRIEKSPPPREPAAILAAAGAYRFQADAAHVVGELRSLTTATTPEFVRVGQADRLREAFLSRLSGTLDKRQLAELRSALESIGPASKKN